MCGYRYKVSPLQDIGSGRRTVNVGTGNGIPSIGTGARTPNIGTPSWVRFTFPPYIQNQKIRSAVSNRAAAVEGALRTECQSELNDKLL